MVYYNLGMDYIAQMGTLLAMVVFLVFLAYLHNRLFRPIVERQGLIERVKMALYDKELEKFCKENEIDYSKIDVRLDACYKKSRGKLKQRLEEIENDLF